MLVTLRTFASGLALLCLCASAAGQDAPLTAEEMAGAARTDALSIPTPGEFMAALNKLGKLDWAAKFRAPISTTYTSRAQMALNLGGLIADGYIAVEAEDKQQVKNIGKDILALAKPLGVSKDIINRGSSMAEFADKGQWDQLKEELEATQNEVKDAMNEHKDQDLVSLVTVGGWLRAMEVITGQVAEKYSEPGAKLLRQPGISSFLTARLDGLPEKMREDATVRNVRKKLGEVSRLTAFPPGHVPALEDVKKLNGQVSDLVKDISKKETK